jgi:AraC family transcriptional regulator, glycine betaine-responsive activator
MMTSKASITSKTRSNWFLSRSGTLPEPDTKTFHLLLLPGFSMMTFSSFTEPLRQANRLLGRHAYDCTLVSIDGEPVAASSGARLMVDHDLTITNLPDYAFVCAGVGVRSFEIEKFSGWLRKLLRHGANIGAISTAPFALAKLGLLDGYKCTIHWESLVSFREEFPELTVTTNLFEIDRDRITCAGATACIDLMLHMISAQFGHAMAASVSEQYNLSQIRSAKDDQHLPPDVRLGSSNPKLLAALVLMDANIETPLNLSEISVNVDLSHRQLERLFHRHVGSSIMKHYQYLRLKRANLLLRQTSLPVSEVALACGYQSWSHFTKHYARQFGHPPVKERVGL